MHPFPPYPPSRSPFSSFQPPHGMHAPFRTPIPGMQTHHDPLNRMFGAIGTGGIPARTSVFSMLDNVQKVLKVAETMGPMVKQYGPMMRNLPSLMTMLKDYQNGTAGKEEAAETEAVQEPDSETSAEPADNNEEPGQEKAAEKTVIAGPAAAHKNKKSIKTAAAESIEQAEEEDTRPSFKKNKLAASGKSRSLFKKQKFKEELEAAVKTAKEEKPISAPEITAESNKDITEKPKNEDFTIGEVKPLRPRPKKNPNKGTLSSKPKLYI
ncbi:VrrA/YqfQ family protein [Fictibacillus aquaticus]|uniref:YqfQ-like protein n=1 Tax=Fictibacillus aquaticus TaxID=2021314 RepID=A0A235FAH2_9BACL|nr:VrrA/YqfQ family protein [Fictibacillus aquaticus]OYD57937.1 hypothetical protein CGZ90_08575 [Fictibacillus aquaticus]